MHRRKSRCCPCPRSLTTSPESPRIVGDSHPLERTGRINYDHIVSQTHDPQYANYLERKAEETRTAQALGMMGRRVLRPGNSPVYMPRDVLDIISNYTNQQGGKRTRKQHSYKKKSTKKRMNRRKTNKRKTNKRMSKRRK